MPKDDLDYVGHMLDSAQTALRLVAGKSRKDYDGEETLRLALAHLCQVVGEAARRISAEFCAAHAQVPWKAIIGMRHKVVHDYLAVDEDVVWRTVTQEMPGLAQALQKILESETSH